jgi:hypothetical protein
MMVDSLPWTMEPSLKSSTMCGDTAALKMTAVDLRLRQVIMNVPIFFHETKGET